MIAETLEARARRLVENEVVTCFSAIIHDLATAFDGNPSPAYKLMEEAMELCTPIDDYEEAAIQAGWSENEREEGDQHVFTDKTDGQTWCANSWEELCRDHDIEPYQREIFEHWQVSEWFGSKLKEAGEKVGDFSDKTIWARTTTGQAIYADHVVETIAKALMV